MQKRVLRADVVIPGAAFALMLVSYAALGLRNLAQMRTTGYDLGIFTQQAEQYAALRAPVSPLLGSGFNTLGDHFSPAMVVFAPFYRLHPHPSTLLIAQAVLFAISVIPLSRWAVRVLGGGAGAVVTTGYIFSWGVQSALNFDVHEIALAVPLLAFSVSALGQQRWRSALGWALPLVFVKEDQGLAVAAIGILVAVLARADPAVAGKFRTYGSLTALWGLGWTALAMKVIIPAFSPNGHYDQGSKLPPPGVAEGLETAHGVMTGDSRAATILLLLLVTGFAALRSPLLLIAVPTLAWRLLSAYKNLWSPNFHYDAVLMPVMFAALIHALARGALSGRISLWERRLALAVVAVVAAASAVTLPVSALRRPQTWEADHRPAAVAELISRVPPGSAVAASNNLVTQIVSDYEVTVFPRRRNDRSTPAWILLDATHTKREAVTSACAQGYARAAEKSGIVLLQKQPVPGALAPQGNCTDAARH